MFFKRKRVKSNFQYLDNSPQIPPFKFVSEISGKKLSLSQIKHNPFDSIFYYKVIFKSF